MEGCWYCGGTGGADLVFSWEFDAYVHRACLKRADDIESYLMSEELAEEGD